MAEIPTLSREYVYIPITALNVDVSDLGVARVAFMQAGAEPTELDWIDDTVAVDSLHPLFQASIGEALAVLVGPARGDAVTTVDLGAGDHQAWAEVQQNGSEERIVRVAGTLTISATGGV